MLMNKDLVQFANGNTDFYEAAMSYFCDKEQSGEKKALTHTAYMAEVERRSGVSRSGIELDAWINHPSVKWSSMSIINATIRAIVPVTVLPQMGVFADIRTEGVGDVTKFTIAPHSYYVVSKGKIAA